MEKIIIDQLISDTWPDVVRIYESCISTKNATFGNQAPDRDSWNKSHRKDCRLVAKTVGTIVPGSRN